MEPPAEIEQYSNSPSKTGQSSPRLTVQDPARQLRRMLDMQGSRKELTPAHLSCEPRNLRAAGPLGSRLDQVGRDAREEVDILVCVELSHLLARSGLGALYTGTMSSLAAA